MKPQFLDAQSRLTDSDGDFALTLSDQSLISLHHRQSSAPTVRESTPSVIIRGYAKFIIRFPYIIPLIIIGLSIGCGVLCLKLFPLPDFREDPTKGFETRGTPIRARAWTLENLKNHRNKDLFLIPNASLALSDLGYSPAGLTLSNAFGRKRRSSEAEPFLQEEIPSRKQRAAGNNFCTANEISVMPPKFVIESTDRSFDLLSVEGIRQVCDLEREQISPYLSPSDCPMKSLPLFATLLTGKSCDTLSENDVSHLRSVLSMCAVYYYNKNLTIESTSAGDGLPPECLQQAESIPKLFYYIFPMGFMNSPNETIRRNQRLPRLLSYVDPHGIPEEPSRDWADFYKSSLHDSPPHFKQVKVVAVNLPDHLIIKYDLFAEVLLHDTVYFIVAAALIVVIMVIYLHSIVLTLATILNVAMSFLFAYAIYHALPQTNFFSFLNLTTAVVLIAIGADDVFIFHDVWLQAKSQTADLDLALARTFSHAALSVLVTSLTTSAAFFVNIVSSITAIQCFGIFAGLAILCNFVLMVTWTPCIIVLIELVEGCVRKHCCSLKCRCSESLSRISTKIFAHWLPSLINRAWFIWIFVFLGLGAGACIVVFVTPKLHLPRMKDFQLFKSSNLLERWNLDYEDKFEAIVAASDQSWTDNIPLYFLWGFKPEDGGNHLDPDSKSSVLTPDPKFEFYSAESQLWLNSFCNNLTHSPLVKELYQRATCSFEGYEKMLKRYCFKSDWAKVLNSGSCCDSLSMPFDPEQLRKCGPAIEMIMAQQARYGVVGEPIYNGSNKVVGYKIYVRSNFEMSMSYSIMDGYYKQIEEFTSKQLETAPESVKGMFFTGGYAFEIFYDLQRGISEGTYYSILLSLLVAFVIMLLTTLNLLLTGYAIITIGFAIICTVATITLMGWDLNILESITISLAVGLSIDFTIHYGVAYRLSLHHDRSSRVNEAFARVGSAVAMAALTTFVAGAAMMPSSILAYTKLGIFLMLVMAYSWFYSTFFFQSVCRFIGPRGQFCQLNALCCPKAKPPAPLDQHSLGSIDSFDSYLVTF